MLSGIRIHRGVRILAIDDEPYLLRLYPRALRGHEVVALKPEEALARITEDTAFDIVLCDLNLPRHAGRWFHEHLVERAACLAGRLVFCTGGACTPEGGRILEASPERVVYKPFDGPELRATIARVAGEQLPNVV